MKKTNRELALTYMNSAGEDREDGHEQSARDSVQEALVHAVLAVADELRELREAINGVEDALEDQDNFGVGTHARNISDALEKIAKR
ncbi:hypothetical protein ACFWDK_05085 [Micromonospora chalcea]